MRRWLEDLLPPCAARDDVVMVASELSANALLHTASGHDGWFTVEVSCSASTIRVAVSDSGAPCEPQVIDDPAAEAGRGLMIVSELATWVAVEGCETGRVVVADVPWMGDAIPHQMSPGHSVDDGQSAFWQRLPGTASCDLPEHHRYLPDARACRCTAATGI